MTGEKGFMALEIMLRTNGVLFTRRPHARMVLQEKFLLVVVGVAFDLSKEVGLNRISPVLVELFFARRFLNIT